MGAIWLEDLIFEMLYGFVYSISFTRCRQWCHSLPFSFPRELTLEFTTTSCLGGLLQLQARAKVIHVRPVNFLSKHTAQMSNILCVSGLLGAKFAIRTVVSLLASYLQLEFCFPGEPQVIYYYFIIHLLYIGVGAGNFSIIKGKKTCTDELKSNWFFFSAFLQEGIANNLFKILLYQHIKN